jgi:PKD repeat protein
MACESACTGLTDVAISGPAQLSAGETGVYTASILPVDATAPVYLQWSNGRTTPEVTYTWDLPGVYTIVITATNCDGASVVTDSHTVAVSDLPIAGLSAANDSPTPLGEPTAFTAIITAGTNVAFTWNFGDGTFGSGAAITHTYAAVGSYTAIVTAANSVNSLNEATPVTVDIPIAGLSAFNDSPTPLGEATTFTAVITAGTNLTFTWDFGDGTLGGGDIVTHTFAAPGLYTATVTATNSISPAIATTLATILDLPIQGLSAVNDSPTPLGEATTFTAVITAGTNVTYTWDFGDGTLGSGAVVTHTYAAAGTYTATVTATNSANSLSQTTLATITAPSPSYRTFLPLTLKRPLETSGHLAGKIPKAD